MANKNATIIKRLNVIQSILHRAVPRSWYDSPSPAFAMRGRFLQYFEVNKFKIKISDDGTYMTVYQALWKVNELCKTNLSELYVLLDTLKELDRIKQLPDLVEEDKQ